MKRLADTEDLTMVFASDMEIQTIGNVKWWSPDLSELSSVSPVIPRM